MYYITKLLLFPIQFHPKQIILRVTSPLFHHLVANSLMKTPLKALKCIKFDQYRRFSFFVTYTKWIEASGRRLEGSARYQLLRGNFLHYVNLRAKWPSTGREVDERDDDGNFARSTLFERRDPSKEAFPCLFPSCPYSPTKNMSRGIRYSRSLIMESLHWRRSLDLRASSSILFALPRSSYLRFPVRLK